MAAHREIVGSFLSPEGLEKAVAALESAGWDRAELSLLGPKNVLNPDKGYVPTPEAVADNPDAKRAPVVAHDDVRQGRALVAGTAGTIAAFAAAGATILTGGSLLVAIIGSAALGGGAAALVEAFGNRTENKREKFFEKQLQQGGILLWARIDPPRSEAKARRIFDEFGASDVHVHEIDGDIVRVDGVHRRDKVDEASDESFPASDPPSWTPESGSKIDPEKLAEDVARRKVG